MFGGNQELVTRAFAAYAAGDLARLVACLHPEVDLVPLSTDLKSNIGPFHGKLGAEQWLQELSSDPQAFDGEAEEIRESGDAVLVLGRVRVQSRPDGSETHVQPVGWVIRVQDELVISFRGYTTPEAAERDFAS